MYAPFLTEYHTVPLNDGSELSTETYTPKVRSAEVGDGVSVGVGVTPFVRLGVGVGLGVVVGVTKALSSKYVVPE